MLKCKKNQNEEMKIVVEFFNKNFELTQLELQSKVVVFFI